MLLNLNSPAPPFMILGDEVRGPGPSRGGRGGAQRARPTGCAARRLCYRRGGWPRTGGSSAFAPGRVVSQQGRQRAVTGRKTTDHVFATSKQEPAAVNTGLCRREPASGHLAASLLRLAGVASHLTLSDTAQHGTRRTGASRRTRSDATNSIVAGKADHGPPEPSACGKPADRVSGPQLTVRHGRLPRLGAASENSHPHVHGEPNALPFPTAHPTVIQLLHPTRQAPPGGTQRLMGEPSQLLLSQTIKRFAKIQERCLSLYYFYGNSDFP